MATIRLLPNAVHFREFQNDPITGHRYHGTCGETALASCMVCSTEVIESTAQAIDLMMSMTREMMSLGWASTPDGATTTGRLKQEAQRRGFTVADPYMQWEDPIEPNKLHGWLLKYAGIKPITLMITKAGTGLRAIDGGHPEYGVQGHFISVVGLADEGYICMDGDNNHVTDHLDIYPWASIQAANVTGFLMLEMQGAPPVAVPAGWTDANGVITAPNGVIVVAGFADHIRHNVWESADYPLAVEEKGVVVEPFGNPSLGSGSRQWFNKHALCWTTKMGVYEMYLGQEHVATLKAVEELKASNDDLTNKLRDAGIVIANDKVALKAASDQAAADAEALAAANAQHEADQAALAACRADQGHLTQNQKDDIAAMDAMRVAFGLPAES
jgi:hypothetical protein